MALNIGTRLSNRYRIVSILGQGGMGAVYRAEDEHLGISVAVKENLYLSDEYIRQFQREAHILANLHHTSLPHVSDYFVVPGQGQYLIMDYIDGEDLRQRIERLGTVPERDVILIGSAICDALTYLHNRQPPVVHRDIKPGNIKITPEGEVVLVDFGLAKLMHLDQSTTTGARAMTPGYSPPEQYGTARTDPRSDIYSLGATVYAALTGIIPEDGLSRATGKTQLTQIRQLQPRIDRRLAFVVEKALDIEPEDRYQTAEEFRRALLEAGDLVQMTRSKLRVSPPPEGVSLEDLPEQQEIIEEKLPKKDKATPSRPLQRRNRLAILSIPAFLVAIAILVGVSFLNPQLASRVLAAFLPSVGSRANPSLLSPTPIQSPSLTPPPKSSSTQKPTLSVTQSPKIPNLTPTPLPTILVTVADSPTPSQSPTPEGTPFGGGYGQIAFSTDRSGSFQIWIMNADGSDQRQITRMVNGACQPNWSPDGLHIAFISPCDSKQNEFYPDASIYTMDLDGSNLQLLPVSQKGDFDPTWAPDGKRIAFTSLRTGTPHIFVYNLEDLTLQELSDSRYPDFQPSWNSDGTQLAFIRNTLYNHVWVMSDKGLTQFQFSTSGNVIDLWPVWAHNGSFIIFTRSQLSPVIPWLVSMLYKDANTAKYTRIPAAGQEDPGPISKFDISSDDHWIIFEGWPDGRNHDLYMMDMNGKNRFRLTTDPGFDFSPAWRPKSH